jgi:prophage regulatory protein
MTAARLTVARGKQEGRAASAGRFLRVADVIATTGLSRATIYRLVANDDFPRQHALTARCIGWWESDVDAWLRARLNPAPG